MSWLFTRREFARRLTAAAALPPFLSRLPRRAVAPPRARPGSFPSGDYTPYGYLDNPYHTWDLHPSGVLRSVPAMGFGFYYPAGPGGYFDFAHGAVYQALLRLGFVIDEQVYFEPEDFAAGQLTAPHHSHLLFTYAFAARGLEIGATFCQVGEDTLAAEVRVRNRGAAPRTAALGAVHEYRLGARDWWGRDGLTGAYRAATGWAVVRSFAAGTVCALGGDQPSTGQLITAEPNAVRGWLAAPAAGAGDAAQCSYYPRPLLAALRYRLEIPAGGETAAWVWLTRGANERATLRSGRRAGAAAPGAARDKRAADDAFWADAPQLGGDWPEHWRRGWVYDFETLRMMVRPPIGAYRHAWDAMQIQAPRNVLAEGSLDMWALSFADPAAAQAVLLGQFQDAVEPNVPCMRESGVMNMVAADGSECGTSIAWCYPFFCIASVFARTRDRAWLRRIHPYLGAFVRWTLAHRTDAAGFVVGKCSWETGMDASARFQIQQPTGGELIDFIRVVELQAAMAHAAAMLAGFAAELGDAAGQAEWRALQARYAACTQQLWNGRDWFQDFNVRAGATIVPAPGQREVGQAAPIFLGFARPEQIEAMRPLLREYRAHPRYYLEWSSLVLPYLESLWTAGEAAVLAEVVADIADRIYRSMDRRAAAAPGGEHLGWPGVSCEMWGLHGAVGGEGYGWGAVMPAHILRNIAGFRESERADQIWIAPNFPAALAAPGRTYAVSGLRYRGDWLTLRYRFHDARRLRVEGEWRGATAVRQVLDAAGREAPDAVTGRRFAFETENRARHRVALNLADRG